MITHNDQLDLFKLISKEITRDIGCYAFGGTAMMFYGFKDETKDVDLLFEKETERTEFIRVLKKLGYEEFSPIKIYIPEKLREKHRPRMYRRGDSRFDLFVGKIFQTVLSPGMGEEVYAVHEFRGAYTLTMHVLRTEHIVMLKGITDRQNDFDDIRTIVGKDKHFDWQYLINEVIWQFNNGDSWILLDTEKMIRELKHYVFIERTYLKQLYDAYEKKKK